MICVDIWFQFLAYSLEEHKVCTSKHKWDVHSSTVWWYGVYLKFESVYFCWLTIFNSSNEHKAESRLQVTTTKFLLLQMEFYLLLAGTVPQINLKKVGNYTMKLRRQKHPLFSAILLWTSNSNFHHLPSLSKL